MTVGNINPEHTTKKEMQASRGSPAPSLFTRSTHAGPPQSHFGICHKQVNAHTLLVLRAKPQPEGASCCCLLFGFPEH